MTKVITGNKSITSIKNMKKLRPSCITCNTCNTFNTFQKGMSFIEILVVIGIFGILGVLTTRAVILTLAGGKKTETLIKIRENINYSFSVIERQLRNADSITDCTNTNTLAINYLDRNGVATSFSCANLGAGTVGYIASGAAQLTGSTIDITSCSFNCQVGTGGNPSSVKINITAQDSTATGISNSIVTSSTSVSLRNY